MTMIISYCRPKTRQRLIAGEEIDWIKNDSKRRRRSVAKIILSYPVWVNKKDIQKIVDLCKRKTLKSGKMHVIDHIIPINHPLVTGLTVPGNLRIILKTKNDSKRNEWREK